MVLKMLLERLRRRSPERAEISDGMGPENWLSARVRLERKRRWAMSEERVPTSS